MEFGLDTFGDVTSGPDGRLNSHAQVIREVIEQAVLADQVGIDAFGVGEHHRPDFAISAPEVVLAAIAGRTKRILLGSAVTVLSSDDPIRVFERFATVDAASNGRAEVTLGRGSFTESFPLFGFDLAQYEALFEEKLDLFAALLKQEPGTWQGNLRAPPRQQAGFPAIGKATAQNLDRGRRQPGIRSPRRALRPAVNAGYHRRRPAAVHAFHRSLQARLCAARPPDKTHRPAFARLCRRHRRASPRRALAAPQGHARQDRRRARLAAGDPGAFRSGSRW